MKKTAKRFSLKSGLLAMILACWLVPIVIVLTVAGAFFERTYSQTIEQEIDFSAQKAMEQVQSRLEEAIAASKSVSYDGLIRQAYQSYTTNGDRAELYLQTNDYLRIFTRTSLYKGVIVHYWEDSVAVSAYHLTSGTTGIDLIHKFQKRLPDIMEQMGKTDTMIRFLAHDGELHMVRNLLDMNFQPYASVIMLLDADAFFRPISAIVRVENVSVWLDGNPYRLREDSFVPVDWEESRPVRQDLIINERLGGRLQVEREIEEEAAKIPVPRLILQPIVENAVEHDITPNRGGKLTLRACQTEQEVTLEVFHEGTMTEKDRENIRRICSDAPLEKRRVGLRNVYRRMKLLYGDRGGLTVEEASAGVIRARLVIPRESAAQAEKESGEVSGK